MSKKTKNGNGKIIVKVLVRNDEKQTYEVSTNSLFANRKNAKLHFFLLIDNHEYYLFEQRFSKGVYLYFREGVCLSQIRKYKNWNKNNRLDKTIEDRIPQCTRYVMTQIA